MCGWNRWARGSMAHVAREGTETDSSGHGRDMGGSFLTTCAGDVICLHWLLSRG